MGRLSSNTDDNFPYKLTQLEILIHQGRRQILRTSCLSHQRAMLLSLEALPGKEVLSDTLVSSSIWKLLCIVLLLANLKNLPLVWHVSTCCLVLFAAGPA